MRYLVLASLAAALNRSAQMAQAMGCDLVNTRWWWNAADLLDASGVVVIDDDRPDFGAVHPLRGFGLDAGERAALQTRAQLGPTKLRDMVTVIAFMARLTPAQRTRLQNARVNNPDLDAWANDVQASGMVDLTDPVTLQILRRMVQAGIVSADDVEHLLREQ